MKIVVQVEPEKVELILDELEGTDFIVDQETYCYFRDEVFINEILKFIEKIAPGKVLETKGYESAESVRRWNHNVRLINKYYLKFNKERERFYLYNNEIYSYNFLGFVNITNEIQLLKYDMEDIFYILSNTPVNLLNRLKTKLGWK